MEFANPNSSSDDDGGGSVVVVCHSAPKGNPAPRLRQLVIFIYLWPRVEASQCSHIRVVSWGGKRLDSWQPWRWMFVIFRRRNGSKLVDIIWSGQDCVEDENSVVVRWEPLSCATE